MKKWICAPHKDFKDTAGKWEKWSNKHTLWGEREREAVGVGTEKQAWREKSWLVLSTFSYQFSVGKLDLSVCQWRTITKLYMGCVQWRLLSCFCFFLSSCWASWDSDLLTVKFALCRNPTLDTSTFSPRDPWLYLWLTWLCDINKWSSKKLRQVFNKGFYFINTN